MGISLLSGLIPVLLTSYMDICHVISPPDVDQVAVSELVRGNNEFAMKLFSEVCSSDRSDNVFLSPYSISSALGMTYTGASGKTASEMADVLNFNPSVETTGYAFNHLNSVIGSGTRSEFMTGDPFVLSIANALWVQDGFNLLSDFTTNVTRYYDAPVVNLDFTGDPGGSRETINAWVAQKTVDKILDLIPEGILGAETRLVLTNAVYFKASWLHPFSELATADSRFILEDGSTVVVPMMTQTEHFSHGESENWSAVSLDYEDGSASMLIIVPRGDFQEFQESFNAGVLDGIRETMMSRNVHLTMPRFEFTRSISLTGVLSSLGMESAFNSSADFSGITGNTDLFISEILHKAYVKVDEKGTEAAAATAVVMSLQAMPEPPIEMNINSPFIFLIMDRGTGSIVFMGRVMNPAV